MSSHYRNEAVASWSVVPAATGRTVQGSAARGTSVPFGMSTLGFIGSPVAGTTATKRTDAPPGPYR